MALVTDSEVKALIDTSRDTTPFITTAHLIITEDLATSGLSTDRKTQVELYLAAHFCAITEERGNLARHRKGDSSEEYKMEIGYGLALTRYGQQAMQLDTSGTLRTLARKGQNASFRII